MDTLTLRDCRDIIRKIVPDLYDVNLIISDKFTAPVDAAAFAVIGPHLGMREYLEQRGEWEGWGPGFICFIKPPTLGVLVHELSHLLPARSIELPNNEEPTGRERKRQELQLAAWASEPEKVHAPWDGHEWEFIRIALHLCYRVHQVFGDDSLKIWDCRVAGDNYALSDIGDFRDRLGCDTSQFLGKSFHDVQAVEPPLPFLQLFERDIRAWFQYLADREIEKCLPSNF